MPLTQRDKKFYEYLCETRLPILSIDASKLFYRSSTDNARSSIVICQRRAKQMQKEQYIEISKKGFGGSVFYYVGTPLIQKDLRKKLTMSSAIANIFDCGIEILKIEVGHQFPKKYNITSDLLLTCKYEDMVFDLVVEVNYSNELNPNYELLIEDIDKGIFVTNNPMYFLSVSNLKSNINLANRFIDIKIDFSNLEKLKIFIQNSLQEEKDFIQQTLPMEFETEDVKMKSREWLIKQRQEKNISQAQLSKISGVSIVTIQAIEQWKRKGSNKTWEALFKALDTPEHSLENILTLLENKEFTFNYDLYNKEKKKIMSILIECLTVDDFEIQENQIRLFIDGSDYHFDKSLRFKENNNEYIYENDDYMIRLY